MTEKTANPKKKNVNRERSKRGERRHRLACLALSEFISKAKEAFVLNPEQKLCDVTTLLSLIKALPETDYFKAGIMRLDNDRIKVVAGKKFRLVPGDVFVKLVDIARLDLDSLIKNKIFHRITSDSNYVQQGQERLGRKASRFEEYFYNRLPHSVSENIVRQFPVAVGNGVHFIDFLHKPSMIAIEIDGSMNPNRYKKRATELLNSQLASKGIRVIQLCNEEVYSEQVLRYVLSQL